MALARRGHPVDAIETDVGIRQGDAHRRRPAESSGQGFGRDAFTTTDDLRKDYQLILLSEVVSDFRTTNEVRGVFEIAARCLAQGPPRVQHLPAEARLCPRRRCP